MLKKSRERMVIRRVKRTQHCAFCKNHGLQAPKKGHQCPYSDCPCLLCKLTKKAQVAMRHQQRVWRHQKQKLKNQAGEEESSTTSGEKSSKGQACDKCRNHNIIKPKRNHECPYNSCDCEYCSLTFKRREIMKHQQRVRRSKIMSQRESESSRSPAENPTEEDEEQDEDIEDKVSPNDVKDVEGASNSPLNSPDGVIKQDVVSSGDSPSQFLLKKSEETEEMEPIQNLSIQFSSLESEYPISPQNHLKAEAHYASSNGSDICSSPPPLLPIEKGHLYYSEEVLSRNNSMGPQYPYGYSTEEYTPAHREKMYYERTGFLQEAPSMEASQISTVTLRENDYSSAFSHPHSCSPLQPFQQTSSSFKISEFHMKNPTTAFGERNEFYTNRNQSRYNHAGVSASFTNFSQTSAMILHEQRRLHYQRGHPVRLPPFDFPGAYQ